MARAAIEQAIQTAQDRLRQRPDDVTAHHQLGDALATLGDLPAAEAALRRAVEIQSDYAPAWARLGNVLRQLGDAGGAIDAFEGAARITPDVAVLSNLGEAQSFALRLDESAATLARAVALDPNHPVPHLNLGVTRRLQGRVEEAIAAFEAAIRLKGDFPQARYNLAIALLLLGDYPRGWEEFEWRLQPPDSGRTAQIFHAFPAWRGEPLDGRTILIHLEQGFGDAFQFARLIPLVAARGGRVLLECRPEVKRLLEPVEGVAQVVEQGQPMPAFDVQCPLMSLPRVLGTTLENIPRDVTYLPPPPESTEMWKTKLAGTSGMKIGLAWSGSPTNTRNQLRSCPPEQLAPLFELSGVTLVNLQKGSPPPHEDVVDCTDQLTDWAETAALVANLDLVITVDTGIAHLAGAMGKPVWTMLSTAADWRYLRGREDSPWYPTMRLFRQERLGDWSTVIERVRGALGEEIRGAARGG